MSSVVGFGTAAAVTAVLASLAVLLFLPAQVTLALVLAAYLVPLTVFAGLDTR